MNEQLSFLNNYCKKENIINQENIKLPSKSLGKAGEYLVFYQLHSWGYSPGINDCVYDISFEVKPGLFAKVQVKAKENIVNFIYNNAKGGITEGGYVRFDCEKNDQSYEKGDFDIFAGAFMKEGKVYYEYNKIPKRTYCCPPKKIIDQDPNFSRNTFDKAIKQFLEDRKDD